ncbi:MAG: hypothetical protein BWY72_02293 [Bacteroidetes bacterium ADurb.Bin416]|nr:MAG: hypothetical protein BWY72_02293 [Bacteroidetes bacterium ADurb.Bin416]
MDLSAMLTNDYDYETQQSAFTYRLITTPKQGTVAQGVYAFEADLPTGTRDTLVYQVGEVRGAGDTLWGGASPGSADQTLPRQWHLQRSLPDCHS